MQSVFSAESTMLLLVVVVMVAVAVCRILYQYQRSLFLHCVECSALFASSVVISSALFSAFGVADCSRLCDARLNT